MSQLAPHACGLLAGHFLHFGAILAIMPADETVHPLKKSPIGKKIKRQNAVKSILLHKKNVIFVIRKYKCGMGESRIRQCWAIRQGCYLNG